MLKYFYLSLLLLLGTPSVVFAQSDADVDTIAKATFKERISIHTNTLGWALMTPNMGIEYDFVHNKHKKISLLISGKYNWQTEQNYNSRYVYNIAGVNAQVRWYFRTRKIDDLGVKPEERIYNAKPEDFTGPWEREKISSTEGFFNRLWASRRLITAKQNPRQHRAYYVGPYAAYDKFSIKLTDTGYQGSAIGAGVTLGYTAPLYLYNSGNAIDFEIGASLGAAVVNYDEYGYNNEEMCYTPETQGESKILPMVSDLRLALVYRFDPIKNQAYEVNYDKLVQERHNYNLRKAYIKADSAYVMPDSVVRFINNYNKGVLAYNTKVRAYNKEILKHENADSTDMLNEQAPAYQYVKMPKKLLNFGSKKMLANKNLTSAEELDDVYLNTLLKQYKPITEFLEKYPSRAIAVDTLLLRDYFALRHDTLSEISYYEYLVKILPNINGEVIKLHNESIINQLAGDTISDTIASRVFLIDRSGTGRSASFIKTTDKFLVKEPKKYEIPSLNEQVISENLNKVAIIKEKYGIIADLGQVDHEAIALKKKQAEEAERVAREKAREEAKAAEEKAKADAEAAKQAARAEREKAKEEAKAAEEQAKADAEAAKQAARAEREKAKEEAKAAEEQGKADEEAVKQAARVEREKAREEAKAAEEQAKADAEAAKQAARAEREKAKEEAKAAAEQAKADKKRAKDEEKARKKQEKSKKEVEDNDAENSNNDKNGEEQ